MHLEAFKRNDDNPLHRDDIIVVEEDFESEDESEDEALSEISSEEMHIEDNGTGQFFSIPEDYIGPPQSFVPLDFQAAAEAARKVCIAMGMEQPDSFDPDTAVWTAETCFDSQLAIPDAVFVNPNHEDEDFTYFDNAGLNDVQIEHRIVESHKMNEKRVLDYFASHGIPENIWKLYTPYRWETFNTIYHWLVSERKVVHVADPFFVMNSSF